MTTTDNSSSDVVIHVADPTSLEIDTSTSDAVSSVVIENIVETILSVTTDSSQCSVDFDLWERYLPEKVLVVRKQNTTAEVDVSQVEKVKVNNTAVMESPTVVWRL